MSIYRPSRPISQRKKPPKLPPIAAFDTETRGLGGDLLAISYCMLDVNGNIEHSAYATGTPEYLANRMLDIIIDNPEYIWYAHNASYDWRYILRECQARYIPMEFLLGGQNRVLSITINNTETRDSYALFNVKLSKFLQVYCPDMPKLEIDVANFDPNNAEHLAYSLRDSEGLALAVHRHRAFIILEFDADIGVSFAGTAMRAWKATIDEPIYSNDADDDFYRACYFGGYVAPLKGGIHHQCKTYDINSSYPAAMRKHGAPSGNAVKTSGREYDDLKDKPGYWRIKVYCPDTVIAPCIGMRKTNGACVWPRGQFVTHATTPEIEFARSIGYIITPLNGIVFSRVEFIFTKFVDKCENLRAIHKGKPTETPIKYQQNSLYGKFGTRKTRSFIEKLPDDVRDWVGFEEFDLLPGYGVKTEHDDDIQAAPHIAAWITAQARLTLFKAIYAGGASEVIYCDTDSLTVTEKFDHSKIPVSNNYGDYKLEKTWLSFHAIAPKVYSGELDSGKWIGACKGIPNPTEEDYKKLFAGEIIEASYNSMPSLSVWLKNGGQREAKTKLRKSTNPANVVGWNIEGENISPIKLKIA